LSVPAKGRWNQALTALARGDCQDVSGWMKTETASYQWIIME
jgi:hypothetical protein